MTPTRRHAVVLGGAGFLGSHLCDALLEAGYRVTAVDDVSTGRPGNVEHLADREFALVRADITAGIPVEGPVDVVANLASPASPPDYLDRPIETLRVGSLGTEHALQLAERSGARMLHASTSEIYGEPLEHPQREDYWGNVNPIGPRSVYDEAKRYAEALVMAYRRRRDTNTGIVRIFNTYGRRMRVDDGRVVPEFFAAALEGRPLPVYGDGSQTRSMCHVSDLIDAMMRMIVSDHAGPVNIGNDAEITMIELAELVQDVVGAHPGVEHHPLPQDDPTRRRPDLRRAREVLGWAPTVDLREGLGRTAPWFRDGLV